MKLFALVASAWAGDSRFMKSQFMCSSYDIVGNDWGIYLTLEECADFCREKANEYSVRDPCCEFGWSNGRETSGHYCTVHRGGFEYRSAPYYDW